MDKASAEGVLGDGLPVAGMVGAARKLGMAPLSPAQRPLTAGCTHHWQNFATASLFRLSAERHQ